MKKKELVKKYKRLEGVWDAPGAETARQIFLQDLEQLDEPGKSKYLSKKQNSLKRLILTETQILQRLYIMYQEQAGDIKLQIIIMLR